MEDGLLTSAQAADMLDISPHQLQKMVRRGILRPDPSGPSTLHKRRFRISDVAALQAIRAKGSNPEAAFVEARQSVMETRALRLELDRLRRVLGVDVPSIPTDRDTVVSLLLKAEDQLRAPATQDPATLLEWARILYALTESHFAAITFHTSQQEPWRAFLQLGRKLAREQDYASTRRNLELNNVYLLLNAALRRARQAAYFHVRELYGNILAGKVFPEVKGCPHEEVIALSFNNQGWR